MEMAKSATVWILLILASVVLMASAFEGTTGACLAALFAPNLLVRDLTPQDLVNDVNIINKTIFHDS